MADGQDPAQIGRRRLLRLLGVGSATAAASWACRSGGSRLTWPGEQPSAGADGRLRARPAPVQVPAAADTSPGLRPLALAEGRDGLLYVPPGLAADRLAPLALLLHGAGGNARAGISPWLGLADDSGLLLLSPDSRASSWDLVLGGYGPDVAFIDRALEQTFPRFPVDPARVAVAGFSDGASYALSLGLTNGDLFQALIAFSPGFSQPARRHGTPRVYVSHGSGDQVLPIERTSRQIVPRLRRDGYDVRYREFEGPHAVPPEIAQEALSWFLGRP